MMQTTPQMLADHAASKVEKKIVVDLEPVCLWQDAKYRVVRRKSNQMGTEIVLETAATRDAMGGISWRDIKVFKPGGEGEDQALFHILDKIAMDLITMTNAVAAAREKK